MGLASRAVEEGPGDSGGGPSAENALPNAFYVENVFAAQDNRRLVTESADHANSAIILLRVVLVQLEVDEALVVLLDALFIKAGQAALLVFEASALVAASMCFVATFVHQVDAILLPTHVSKCSLLADRGLRQRLPAESAFQSDFVLFCLSAVHADVVRVFLAICAEVVGAGGASNTVSRHVLGCLPRHRLS